MHNRWTPNSILTARGRLLALALLALAGCATNSPRVAMPKLDAMPGATPVAADKDVMLQLLAGQFALQHGDLVEGALRYANAAELSPQADIAETATRLALAVRNWPLAERALARWHQLAPAASGLIQARAWIALGEGHADAAYADLAALAAKPDEPNWRLIAQALLGAADKQVAVGVLGRLATPAQLGHKESVWVAASQLAWKLGDKALAQRLSDQAVARFHSADAYAWNAHLALDRGDKAAARAAYADALKRDPESTRLRGGYAALLSEMGDNAGAARVLAEGPQNDITYGGRAAYAARANDKAALTALYGQMQTDKTPRTGQRLFLLGQTAELIGKRDRAVEWYSEVPDDDAHWFDAQVRRAVVLDQEGKTADALVVLRQLEDQVGDDPKQLGDAYLVETDLLVRHERKREALAAYARGLTALPDDTRLLYARALLAVDMDDLANGERDLRRIIALEPDNAEALNALGYTLADRTRQTGEALDLIEKAIKLKPDEPAIIDSMGWVQYRLGHLDTAVKDLQRAYAKQPDPEIAAHLGEVLWVKGDRAGARKVWEQGRKKDPKNKPLLETIQRLTS